MNRTKIEWCDYTWNPVSGCSGPNGVRCPYCYAARLAHRFHRSFEPTFHRERLEEPGQVKQPSKIFVCSAGDLFDPTISFEQIAQVYAVMWIHERHTFQVLTKRPERALEFYRQWSRWFKVTPPALPNVWLGVTAEDQAAADERIPLLLQTPAAVKFVSCEPLHGFVDLREWFPPHDWPGLPWGTSSSNPSLLWVIVGAQTGAGAKPPSMFWVWNIVDQCKAAGVPVFVKNNVGWRDNLNFPSPPPQEFPKVEVPACSVP